MVVSIVKLSKEKDHLLVVLFLRVNSISTANYILKINFETCASFDQRSHHWFWLLLNDLARIQWPEPHP